jgi:hypothetical protein
MLRYRPPRSGTDDDAQPAPLTPDALRALIADAVRPAHFFTGPKTTLQWEHLPTEETPWEVFQGRLLDRAHTRRTRTFEAWNVHMLENGTPSAEPLLAVKLDAAAGELHVTRGLLCRVWEGYHAGDNVYLSREAERWVRELAGTILRPRFADIDDLRDELTGRLFQAVVGASRLPLTSVEAPLPAFALGELAYFYRPGAARDAGPMRSWRELIRDGLHSELSWSEKVKMLEALLRAAPAGDLTEAASLFAERWEGVGESAATLPRLLRTLFNDVSLSPWTDFVEKVLRFVSLLVEGGKLAVLEQVDFLAHLLGQLGRHLTAYDLVLFHHRGANYPDALLLDAVLKEYLRLARSHRRLFALGGHRGQMRLRALRQGVLLRRRYEGHPVPDAPTSPGENARVLPPPHRRVPDEQILNPVKRIRRLYDGDPLPPHLGEHGRRMLREGLEDLRRPGGLRELGEAVFIDRPLGVFKAPAEPDQTPLLAYQAFSRSIAERRLRELARDPELGIAAAAIAPHVEALKLLAVTGLPLDAVGPEPRPVVSLGDARKAADDFILIRTLPGSVSAFLRLYDLAPLRERFDLGDLDGGPRLIVRGFPPAAGKQALVDLYDVKLRKRVQLGMEAGAGYGSRGGVEYPLGGLRVLRVWQPAAEGLVERDVSAEGLILGPRR